MLIRAENIQRSLGELAEWICSPVPVTAHELLCQTRIRCHINIELIVKQILWWSTVNFCDSTWINAARMVHRKIFIAIELIFNHQISCRSTFVLAARFGDIR